MSTLHPSLMPDEWYHGSASEEPFERFDHTKSKPGQEWNGNKHWNSHLGSHWTSIHSVGRGLSQDHGGLMYHADLALKNPRHFDSEHDMDDDALAFHRQQRPWDDDLSSHTIVRDLTGRETARIPQPANHILTEHDDARDLALRYKEHLQRQGYDGVTYGNEYEGPKRHLCAIAFHPDQIHLKDHHGAYDDCASSEEVCGECGREAVNLMGECNECGADQSQFDPEPVAHKASSEYLANPYHSGDEFHHTWFHGSPDLDGKPPHSPDGYRDDQFAGEGRATAGPQMNKILGTHFSALRSVAKGFAKDWRDSEVYHAGLRMKNPAYFPSEHHLDTAIFRHVVKNHPEFTNDEKFASSLRWSYSHTPRMLAERDRQIQDSGQEAPGHVTGNLAHSMSNALQWHPKQREYAQSFVDHLKSQGHDGIVYGNVVEGPKYHHCAIAFHPDDIDIQHIAKIPESPKGLDPEKPWSRTPSAERIADDALDEHPHALEDIENRHTGGDRYSGSGNLDHGPWKPYHETPDYVPYSKTAAFYDRTPRQQSDLEDHLAQHHPGIDPKSPMVDWLHRAEHMNAGDKTMGPKRGQDPLFGGLGHDHPPTIDPYRSSWDREASLEPVYRHRYGRTGTEEEGQGIAEALHPATGEVIGALRWDLNSEPATVIDMSVDEAHRRRGIGTRLFDLARQHDSSLVHSDVLTEDGRKFRDSFQAARKPVRRDPLTGIEMCRKKVDGFPCKYLLGHSQDCAVDWSAAYEHAEDEGTTKEAATRRVSDTASDGDGIVGGMMIAIVPPKDLAHRLHVEEGEHPEQLHVTLAYLGRTEDYEPDHVANLHEVVEAWAEGHAPLRAAVQGAGTFVKASEDGQHVLWASVDAPGLERLHVALADYLSLHGYQVSRDHVFTPHMTLAYGKHHFRFLPKIEREEWLVDEIWVCVAGRWESVRLSGKEGIGERAAGRGRPRRERGAGDPAQAGEQGGAGAPGEGPAAPRPVTFHPRAEKDLAGLHRDDQRRILDTIEKIRVDDPTLQTHRLNGRLSGWYSTKASRGHRVVHQPDGSGGIHIGYVGLHEYGDAINRLG